jgi:hypothetical protein
MATTVFHASPTGLRRYIRANHVTSHELFPRSRTYWLISRYSTDFAVEFAAMATTVFHASPTGFPTRHRNHMRVTPLPPVTSAGIQSVPVAATRLRLD